MRTDSISYTIDGVTRTGKVTYPDLWCFAFNPCYVEFSIDDETSTRLLVLSIQSDTGSYDLNVSLFRGKANVYISKVLQLLFTTPEKVRTVSATLSVKDGTTQVLQNDITLNAIWGCLKIGEQFGKYGSFVWKGRDLSHIRNVVWFKNFPFYVSMFRASGNEITSKYDNEDVSTKLRIFRGKINYVVEGDLPTFQDVNFFVLTPIVVLNKTHGIIYCYDGSLDSKPYSKWSVGDVDYGDADYYMSDGSIRTDVEFAYNNEIVRWNSETKELETSFAGNAGMVGIIDLNPAITFPDAKSTACYNINIVKPESAIFDANFNLIFPDTTKVVNEMVNLFISDAKDGLYLRWMDKYGFLQYYLFREGTTTVKTSTSSDTIQVERNYGGMYYGSMERIMEVTNEETIKCCAVNLPKGVLEYVKTIVNAPIVDLYLGKTKYGTELWLPVSVSDGSYSTNAKTMLSDYEIVIEKTDNISQTL